MKGIIKFIISNIIFAILFTTIGFILAELFTGGQFSGNFWNSARTVFYVACLVDIVFDLLK